MKIHVLLSYVLRLLWRFEWINSKRKLYRSEYSFSKVWSTVYSCLVAIVGGALTKWLYSLLLRFSATKQRAIFNCSPHCTKNMKIRPIAYLTPVEWTRRSISHCFKNHTWSTSGRRRKKWIFRRPIFPLYTQIIWILVYGYNNYFTTDGTKSVRFSSILLSALLLQQFGLGQDMESTPHEPRLQ